MNCYLKELNQINTLGTVLQQFCKRRKVSETTVYCKEILILALDKKLLARKPLIAPVIANDALH